jgi:hypothetical protein
MSGDHPGILIVGLDGRSRISQYGAHAPANYDFDVGKVGEDLRDRPFIGGQGACGVWTQ